MGHILLHFMITKKSKYVKCCTVPWYYFWAKEAFIMAMGLLFVCGLTYNVHQWIKCYTHKAKVCMLVMQCSWEINNKPHMTYSMSMLKMGLLMFWCKINVMDLTRCDAMSCACYQGYNKLFFACFVTILQVWPCWVPKNTIHSLKSWLMFSSIHMSEPIPYGYTQ